MVENEIKIQSKKDKVLYDYQQLRYADQGCGG
jgi:hypothetical protein